MSVSKPVPAHCSDEQLLLYADGELSVWRRHRVRRHVNRCERCRQRMIALDSMLTGLEHHQIAKLNPGTDPSGPRAMLRARITELDRQSAGQAATQYALMRIAAYASVLAILGAAAIGLYRHHVTNAPVYAQSLPDPVYTPGSTHLVAIEQLCSTSADVVADVPADLQQRVFREYGIKGAPAAEFEVDYLITPGLGGAEDVRNLWPEPHGNTEWNSYVKDQLEDRLHNMVCARQIDLGEAQRAIASNWIVAYKKYFHTDKPLQSSGLRTENDPPAALKHLIR
ncbi:zf-HC2 domain-containing protein [Acidicapsa dinghuensis]|uniref:Zf-HC2 domain-containing protein n=1 Tax=Acidicapsa dinghuensis TaxID=2218256 RepID=A0ABW1EI50_9BACT|nr:zf-HC2 domain-containing protein [Acidicapsa dinghuensis]